MAKIFFGIFQKKSQILFSNVSLAQGKKPLKNFPALRAGNSREIHPKTKLSPKILPKKIPGASRRTIP